MISRPSRILGVVAAATLLTGTAGAASTATAAETGGLDRATLTGTVPQWANTTAKGTDLPANQRLDLQVTLPLADPAAAASLATAVSTPGNPLYGKHLSPKEFTSRFAPAPETVTAVADWLRSSGLTVHSSNRSARTIVVSGSAATIGNTFQTTLSSYRYKGRTLHAPTRAASIPRALAGKISQVLGLDGGGELVQSQQVKRPVPTAATVERDRAKYADAAEDTSCGRFWAEHNNTSVPQRYGAGMQSNQLCGYHYAQMRAMHQLRDGQDGAGRTVAITGAFDAASAESDTNRSARETGAPTLTAGQYESHSEPPAQQPRCRPAEWAGEQIMDIQAVHNLAPKAKIVYYGASDCTTLWDTLRRAVTDGKASVISNSWSATSHEDVAEATAAHLTDTAVQAAIQGIALIFSSGDAGDNSGPTAGGKLNASFPATSPWITAAGGTLHALNRDSSTKFVTGWQNTGNTLAGGQWQALRTADGAFAGGAGGGVSRRYEAPEWQNGVVPAGYAKGHRAIPDVGMLADASTGMYFGHTTPQGWIAFAGGGTSLSAPLLAGLIAVAEQGRGESIGFLNPSLYRLAGTPALVDVKPVGSGVFKEYLGRYPGTSTPVERGKYLVDNDAKPQSLQSSAGWDNTTGLGFPGTQQFLSSIGR